MAGDLARAAALIEADALPALAIAALPTDPFQRLD
jgi:histidine ammonia-lyase